MCTFFVKILHRELHSLHRLHCFVDTFYIFIRNILTFLSCFRLFLFLLSLFMITPYETFLFQVNPKAIPTETDKIIKPKPFVDDVTELEVVANILKSIKCFKEGR